jgi:hypothetical protein
MPNFEGSRTSKKKISYVDDYSYTKVLGLFTKGTGKSPADKSHRVSVSFKTNISYETALHDMKDDTYQQSAGTDLSNIFMPFQTALGSGDLPCFDQNVSKLNIASGVNGKSLLPFYYDSKKTNVIYDRWAAPSGDSINHLVSSKKYYGDSNRYRDVSNIRGIGLRLPVMAVGWGYTMDGNPYPSGKGKNKFKGEYDRGYDVDPSDYVAAPIDLRYDTERNVWTTFSQPGFWARIQSASGFKLNNNDFVTINASGTVYGWQEVELQESGNFIVKRGGRVGTLTNKPAYEINHMRSFAGDLVWLNYDSTKDFYVFQKPLVKGNTKYQVLMIADETFQTAVWDYPRFH